MENVEDIYDLSPMQQGMLFHLLYDQGSGMYFEQVRCTVTGPLNPSIFREAWQRVMDINPILRTAFIWEGLDKPLQVVRQKVDLPWAYYDWQGLAPDRQEKGLEEFFQADITRGFLPGQAPLMRCAVIRQTRDTYKFTWSYHHLILDGWSFPLVLADVFKIYESLLKGEATALEERRPYRDYIAWLQAQDIPKAEVYWKERLKGFTAPTPIMVERNLDDQKFFGGPGPAARGADKGFSKKPPGRRRHQEVDGAEEDTLLSNESTGALIAAARESHLTLNTLIQGAWSLLMSRYSREDDIVFGVTVSGRSPEIMGSESMVGLFINTLPLRVQVPGEAFLIPWLKEIMAGQAELERYSYTPLIEIRGWSEVPHPVSLFHSIVVFENYPLKGTSRELSTSLVITEIGGYNKNNYPLTVVVTPGPRLSLCLRYDPSLFHRDTIRRMKTHFKTLLENMARNLHQPLSRITMLTDAERELLLYEWNKNHTVYEGRESIHQLIEKQEREHPDTVALVLDDKKLTYREMNRRANRQAHRLRAEGIGSESKGAHGLVGIYSEPSPEMVIGLLGILKAGAAYVPLETLQPKERLAYILRDTAVSLVLTTIDLADKLPGNKPPLIYLDNQWGEKPGESAENTAAGTTPGDPAYIIYTSGSTGRPKGVMVTHYNVVRLFEATQAWYEFTDKDVWSLFHSYAFDFSVWETWGSLIYGGRLVVFPYWVTRSPGGVHKLLRSEGVTVFNQTPSAFIPFIQEEGRLDKKEMQALRLVIFGGEPLDFQKLRPWFERHGDRSPRLVNMYGITETTVHVTYRPLTADDPEKPGSMIGTPIPDLRIYILDMYGQPVPIGVAGEMVIGGAGLARGYLNRPELTAEKFCLRRARGAGTLLRGDLFIKTFIGTPRRGAGPYKSFLLNSPEGRLHLTLNTQHLTLYQTGDLARYLPAGDIEYIGRTDHQVKIRGFRIEPGEIESALCAHPHVQDAVVVARENKPGDKGLVAYIVTGNDSTEVKTRLREYLLGRLPNYMVPTSFVILDALPLTASGKVDRRALPTPNDSTGATREGCVPPRTPTEEKLASIWSEVLGLEKVGVEDNFFQLGGHSLLVTQVISRLREVFRVNLEIKVLYEEADTIAALARRIEAIQQAARLAGSIPGHETEDREEFAL